MKQKSSVTLYNVTFDQFNASILNKTINFFQINTTKILYWPQIYEQYMFNESRSKHIQKSNSINIWAVTLWEVFSCLFRLSSNRLSHEQTPLKCNRGSQLHRSLGWWISFCGIQEFNCIHTGSLSADGKDFWEPLFTLPYASEWLNIQHCRSAWMCRQRDRNTVEIMKERLRQKHKWEIEDFLFCSVSKRSACRASRIMPKQSVTHLAHTSNRRRNGWSEHELAEVQRK